MSVQRWFRDRPIHIKLTLIALLVALTGVLPMICISIGYEYHSVRQAMLREAEAQVSIIRDNVAAATAFEDGESANEILHALHWSPDVVRALLFQKSDGLLASYAAPGFSVDPQTASCSPDTVEVDWQHIVICRSVLLKQDTVGTLLVETSLDRLHERMRLYFAIGFVSALLGVGIACLLAWHLKKSIAGPLSELMALASQVTSRQDYAVTRRVYDSADEIGGLSRAFDKMLDGIEERDRKLSQMAYFDAVSGLRNRHYFMERLGQATENARRYGMRCHMMFIDLDNFKPVNDTYGHDVGDALLAAVGVRLQAALRENDVVCRLGGDEFAVIMENAREPAEMAAVADKIITSLSAPFRIQMQQIVIGASVGLSTCPDLARDAAELLTSADAAMYEAKQQGKNRYCLYNPQRTPNNPPKADEPASARTASRPPQ